MAGLPKKALNELKSGSDEENTPRNMAGKFEGKEYNGSEEVPGNLMDLTRREEFIVNKATAFVQPILEVVAQMAQQLKLDTDMLKLKLEDKQKQLKTLEEQGIKDEDTIAKLKSEIEELTSEIGTKDKQIDGYKQQLAKKGDFRGEISEEDKDLQEYIKLEESARKLKQKIDENKMETKKIITKIEKERNK